MNQKIRLLISFSFALLFCSVGFAQFEPDDGIGQVYERKTIQQRQPMSYQPIREADVMWSKVVWRSIPMGEKMNQVYYYPRVPIGDRKSLISVLLDGIQSGRIIAYNPSDPYNEFKQQITFQEIKERFDAEDEILQVNSIGGEEEEDSIRNVFVAGEINSSEVMEYLVKEEWIFDKQRSVLEVRIMGICPVRHFYRDEDIDREELLKRKLFWVSFKDIRPIMAQQRVMVHGSNNNNMTYDDLLVSRFFQSYIIQESNIYDNRAINEYLTGVEALYEAERIKENIRNFEIDLWEY